MEKQVFLDFRLRFNLRQSKQEKPTIIYAVFVWQGVQYKVNTSLKIYPSHWDAKSQTATVSNRLSMRDNQNNMIANDKIALIKTSFYEKKNYLCTQIDADVVKEITNAINPNIRQKNMETKKQKIRRNRQTLWRAYSC